MNKSQDLIIFCLAVSLLFLPFIANLPFNNEKNPVKDIESPDNNLLNLPTSLASPNNFWEFYLFVDKNHNSENVYKPVIPSRTGFLKENPPQNQVEIVGKGDSNNSTDIPAGGENHNSIEHNDYLKGQEYLSSQEKIELWIELLNFLASPIQGAKVSNKDSHLPNAPRSYRNGTHEGLDYYNGYCGVTISKGMPVVAAAGGVVIRIDHDYIELTKEQRDDILKIAARQKTTPEDILDKLRGRQVWIKHQDDIVTRYAHLHTVSEDLQVGDRVLVNQYIGQVGNSGTSDAVNETWGGAHLHFEILINNRYFGEGLTPIEIRTILSRIL